VRKDIASKRRRSIKESVWLFLNSAFGLWLLSTVVISIATAIYTKIQTDRAEKSKTAELKRKLEVELANRVGVLDNGLDALLSGTTKIFTGSVTMTVVNIDAGKRAESEGLNGSIVFSEFKDRTFQSLVFEFEQFAPLEDKNNLREAVKIIERIKDLLQNCPSIPYEGLLEGISEDRKKEYLRREKEVLRRVNEAKELLQTNPLLKRWSGN
jgi:hypothetical protein